MAQFKIAHGQTKKLPTALEEGQVYVTYDNNGQNGKIFADVEIDGETVRVALEGEQGPQGKSAYQYAQEGGYQGTEQEFAQLLNGLDSEIENHNQDELAHPDIREEISQLSSEKVDKNYGAENVGKILVVGTDGNLTLADMPEGGASGDVVGVLDESNNILLSGDIAEGVYPLKWIMTDGTLVDAGTLTVAPKPEPEVETYSVTNTLANCTTSNDTQIVSRGANYSATITKDEAFAGHTAIYVTMGGVDISATAVSGDNINIESVTGDIIISCVAYEANKRLSSSGEKEQTGCELTGFIPLTYNDTLYMKGVAVNATTAIACCYTAATTGTTDRVAFTTTQYIFTGNESSSILGEVVSCKLSDVELEDIKTHKDTIAFIRMTGNEINANSIITVNQPIV